MKKICVKIKYINNVYRKELLFSKCSYCTPHQLIEAIISYLQNENQQVSSTNLYSSDFKTKVTCQTVEDLIYNNTLSIIYNGIIALSNAYEFDRKDGIIYYFHTSEKSHKEFPHIHAKYGDDEISIYLSSMKIIGHFKSNTKTKDAKKYVQNNKTNILLAWNQIFEV